MILSSWRTIPKQKILTHLQDRVQLENNSEAGDSHPPTGQGSVGEQFRSRRFSPTYRTGISWRSRRFSPTYRTGISWRTIPKQTILTHLQDRDQLEKQTILTHLQDRDQLENNSEADDSH